jgi:Ca2+-binding RTX toxin-like protein
MFGHFASEQLIYSRGTLMTFSYSGTNGNDSLDYAGQDSLYALGYAGNDNLWGDDYNDSIYGGAGNDTLLGYGGNDLLVGGTGSDILKGGAGNDVLDGFSWGYNREIDQLTGGTGIDTFVLGDATGVSYLGGRTSSGQDESYGLIRDWNSAEDFIQLHGSSSSYHLDKNHNWFGSAANDTGIFMGNDLIGVVVGSTDVSLSRDFTFV